MCGGPSAAGGRASSRVCRGCACVTYPGWHCAARGAVSARTPAPAVTTCGRKCPPPCGEGTCREPERDRCPCQCCEAEPGDARGHRPNLKAGSAPPQPRARPSGRDPYRRFPLHDLEDMHIELDVAASGAVTVAGLVSELLGRLPTVGDEVRLPSARGFQPDPSTSWSSSPSRTGQRSSSAVHCQPPC